MMFSLLMMFFHAGAAAAREFDDAMRFFTPRFIFFRA